MGLEGFHEISNIIDQLYLIQNMIKSGTLKKVEKFQI